MSHICVDIAREYDRDDVRREAGGAQVRRGNARMRCVMVSKEIQFVDRYMSILCPHP